MPTQLPSAQLQWVLESQAFFFQKKLECDSDRKMEENKHIELEKTAKWYSTEEEFNILDMRHLL